MNQRRGNSLFLLHNGVVSYVRTGHESKSYDFFTDIARELINFREYLFQNSKNWKFPIYSFISEIDALADFYVKLINLTENKNFHKT